MNGIDNIAGHIHCSAYVVNLNLIACLICRLINFFEVQNPCFHLYIYANEANLKPGKTEGNCPLRRLFFSNYFYDLLFSISS
jgi:hypothetical protein